MQDILLFIQHHAMLCLALAVILVFLIVIEFIKIKRGTATLTPARVVQLINHEEAVVVDVRNSESFATGHIIDAISLPAKELGEKTKKLEKFKSRPIVLVCATGTESQQTSILLKNQGFNVYTIAGGLRGWREADMPLVKG